LGAGIALSFQYEKKKNICVTLYGDGAANQGIQSSKYFKLKSFVMIQVPQVNSSTV